MLRDQLKEATIMRKKPHFRCSQPDTKHRTCAALQIYIYIYIYICIYIDLYIHSVWRTKAVSNIGRVDEGTLVQPSSHEDQLYLLTYVVVAQDQGYLVRGPYSKDYSILGSILGYPNFGKLPCIPGCARCSPSKVLSCSNKKLLLCARAGGGCLQTDTLPHTLVCAANALHPWHPPCSQTNHECGC